MVAFNFERTNPTTGLSYYLEKKRRLTQMAKDDGMFEKYTEVVQWIAEKVAISDETCDEGHILKKLYNDISEGRDKYLRDLEIKEISKKREKGDGRKLSLDAEMG